MLSLMEAAAQPVSSILISCFTFFVVGPDATKKGFLKVTPPIVTGMLMSFICLFINHFSSKSFLIFTPRRADS